jgi:NitT/TauT family transport system substrate-binding protein
VRILKTAAVLTVAALAAACGGASADDGTGTPTLRLGYFPNVTHASAIVGVEEGLFQKHLPAGVTLDTKTFNAGPAAIEALFSGALDLTYLGPSPSINAYAKSKGGVRIISGATSGGASLVVKTTIASAADLKGKKVATPQLGGTQDVAARAWLKAQGLKTDTSGGGDVSIVPQDNATTLDAFKQGAIDGAWVPEPWATRLVQEGGGKVLLDEASLWPQGRWVTTNLLVSKDFLDKHADLVEAIVRGQVDADQLLRSDPARAQAAVSRGIEKATTKKIADPIIASSFKAMTFTNDPIASSLKKEYEDARGLGLLKDDIDLSGIYDLTNLNKVLAEAGQPKVASAA